MLSLSLESMRACLSRAPLRVQAIRNRVLQSFLRRPLFTPDNGGEEAPVRAGRWGLPCGLRPVHRKPMKATTVIACTCSTVFGGKLTS